MKLPIKILMLSFSIFLNAMQESDVNVPAFTIHASKGRSGGLCCSAPIDATKGPLFIQEVKKEIISLASMGIEIYNLSGNRDIEIGAGYTFVILNNSNAGDISFPGPFQGRVKLVGDSTVGKITGGVIE